MSHKLNRSVFFSDLEKVHIIALTSETSQTTRDEKVSECDQEIPQSHSADQPTAPRGRVTEHSSVRQ